MAKERQTSKGKDGTNDRKQRVLTRASASTVRNISDAVVAKDGEPFFICPPDGQIPTKGDHGFGLYHHDCRFLSGYELRVGGTTPTSLAASEADGTTLKLELTNTELHDGKSVIGKEQLGLMWTRRVDAGHTSLEDELSVRNYGRQPATVPVELDFAATFQDVFDIRGLLDERPGKQRPTKWRDGRLEFRYAGADGIDRSLELRFDPAPNDRGDTSVRYELDLEPRTSKVVHVTARIRERPRSGARPIEQRSETTANRGRHSDSSGQHRSAGVDRGKWPVGCRSSSLALDSALDRALADLTMLRGSLDGYTYYAAGIPWFSTLFGRDSLITSLETIFLDPEVAEDTLRLLASRQGRVVDDWRDEQPGKILHELRVGELARLDAIPQTPYYGTIDATPLFLIVLVEHANWTGSLRLFHDLRPNIEAALKWIDDYGDTDGDGYVDYQSTTQHGLINQGWKDSGDGIVTEQGDIAQPPIALAEVQGYVYRAWLGLAGLFEHDGDKKRAQDLRQRADELAKRFERDFWDDKLGTYILALANGKPCRVVASNAGQVLWSGLPSADRAAKVAQRLERPDVFNGWGIRTLSAKAAAYHPIGYHLGTVWPHDNAIIADGFRRYGLVKQAAAVTDGMLEAAQHFRHARLPECFAGYDRSDFASPVHYPVACHPQAWAAGSVPYLLSSSLGLRADGLKHELHVRQPNLPSFVEWFELNGLAIGGATVDLRFSAANGRTEVEIQKVEGEVNVVVEGAD